MIEKGSQDYKDLQRAVSLLETPSLTARISNLIGSPIEAGVNKLPANWKEKINDLTKAALFKAVDGALLTMDNNPGEESSTKLNKLYAATSGAVGGAFGLAGIAVELPISTTIIMRAIADVARSEGFDLEDFRTKTACIEVLSLGGETSKDDAAETGYYITRAFMTEMSSAFGKGMIEAAARAAKPLTLGFSGITGKQTGSMLAKLIERVAQRFGIVITQKVAVQAAPIVGALSGAAINTLFTDFYQDMARGHFIVKRLELKYGEEMIKDQYTALAKG
ncbi:EcsC family protein [Luteimonas sp. SDU101]|uniref:EcsC family protein n=1 Tax=Luteimonas sp. SDU101 TaxID=3422593 RepID=UPI003EBE5ACC